jgi:hypothetical protein
VVTVVVQRIKVEAKGTSEEYRLLWDDGNSLAKLFFRDV